MRVVRAVGGVRLVALSLLALLGCSGSIGGDWP